MHIQKQLTRLEKGIVSLKCHGQTAQDTSLQASAEALLVPHIDGEVFCIIFVVIAKQYPYHISLVYLKVHFTAWVTFSGDFSL